MSPTKEQQTRKPEKIEIFRSDGFVVEVNQFQEMLAAKTFWSFPSDLTGTVLTV